MINQQLFSKQLTFQYFFYINTQECHFDLFTERSRVNLRIEDVLYDVSNFPVSWFWRSFKLPCFLVLEMKIFKEF